MFQNYVQYMFIFYNHRKFLLLLYNYKQIYEVYIYVRDYVNKNVIY